MRYKNVAKEEEIEMLVERIMRRQEITEAKLDKKTVRNALLEHAKTSPTKCVNCLNSKPSLGVFSWRRRGCSLSLPYVKEQGKNCPLRKPIFVVEGDAEAGASSPTFISSEEADQCR